MPIAFRGTRMPWARGIGREWEQELQRYSSEQQGLTGRPISEQGMAAMTYGMTEAELAGQEEHLRGLRQLWYQKKQLEAQKPRTGAAIGSAVGSLLPLAGMALGGPLGGMLGMGASKAVTGFTNTPGFMPSGPMETGLTTGGQAMPESIRGGAYAPPGFEGASMFGAGGGYQVAGGSFLDPIFDLLQL